MPFIDLFPYELRQYQSEMMAMVYDSIAKERHLVVEAPTGIGKTVATLVPALAAAAEFNLKIVYLTRTNAQQEMIMKELRAIKEFSAMEFSGTALQGRRHLCLFAIELGEADASPADLARFCSSHKKNGTCPFLRALRSCEASKARTSQRVRERIIRKALTAEQVLKLGIEHRFCPLEAIRSVLSIVDLVTVPYIYYLHPTLRESLLKAMDAKEHELVVIVDEAHNLPDHARDVLTSRLSYKTLARARRETKDPKAYRLLDALSHALFTLADEHNEKQLVPKELLKTIAIERLGATEQWFEEAIVRLERLGDIYKIRNGKATSTLSNIALFVQHWLDIDEPDIAHLLDVEKKSNPAVEIYSMDPTRITKHLLVTHSSIHISGSLRPLQDHITLVGLPDDTNQLQLPSPFPEENRMVLYTNNLTTQYQTLYKQPDMITKIRDLVYVILKKIPHNTIVFYPSYRLMDNILKLEPDPKGKRQVYIERSNASQHTHQHMTAQFKNSRNATLHAVMGGRIAEGIDFPGSELSNVIIVGLPYPPPTAKNTLLKKYLDKKTGRGYQLTIKTPATRKILQAIGRLIRSPTDRGTVTIIDHRAHRLQPIIPELKPGQDLIQRLETFHNNNNS